MFKYKIKCIAGEYHIYRKKKWWIFWEDWDMIYTSKEDAQLLVNYLNREVN